jgi:hypothetical protein
MNQGIVGVLSTLVCLGGIGMIAPKDKAPPQRVVLHYADKGDKPKAAAPAPVAQPQTPPLSAEQQRALEQAFNLPPGSSVEVDIVNRDMGSVRTSQEGRGVGAGAVAEGDKLDQKFNGTPPVVGLGADGTLTGSGGGADADQKGSALKIPPLPWQNPLFWIGIALLAGTGGCVYLGLRRAALICGVGGVGCLAAAFYPGILLFAVAGVLLAVFGPYLYAEFKKKKAEVDDGESYEALRAMVGGVYHRNLGNDMKTTIQNLVPNLSGVDLDKVVMRLQKNVQDAIAKEAGDKDKVVIDEVMKEDRLGKHDE